MKPEPQDTAASSADRLSGLVQAVACTRDRQAFAALFAYFAPRLKTYLIRTGSLANVAEELAQETMLTVWRKAAYFDPARAAAATWIFTIARNLRIDHERRDRHAPPVEHDPDDEEDDLLPSAETMLVNDERETRVRAALGALSEDQATIMRLSFFSEKPHAQIAQELGIPLGTVKSRVRLAMNRLRNLLRELS